MDNRRVLEVEPLTRPLFVSHDQRELIELPEVQSVPEGTDLCFLWISKLSVVLARYEPNMHACYLEASLAQCFGPIIFYDPRQELSDEQKDLNVIGEIHLDVSLRDTHFAHTFFVCASGSCYMPILGDDFLSNYEEFSHNADLSRLYALLEAFEETRLISWPCKVQSMLEAMEPNPLWVMCMAMNLAFCQNPRCHCRMEEGPFLPSKPTAYHEKEISPPDPADPSGEVDNVSLEVIMFDPEVEPIPASQEPTGDGILDELERLALGDHGSNFRSEIQKILETTKINETSDTEDDESHKPKIYELMDGQLTKLDKFPEDYLNGGVDYEVLVCGIPKRSSSEGDLSPEALARFFEK